MTKAEIIAAIKEIDGYTAMEGKAIVDMAQMALLNKLLERLQGTALIGDVGLQVGGVDVSDTNPIPASLTTNISSAAGDTIAVDNMPKGATVSDVLLTNITATATGSEIDCRPFNGVDIQFKITAGTGKWDIEILGDSESGGTFKSQFLGRSTTPIKKSGLTANAGFSFPVTANFIKIAATEVTNGATISITATPCVIATVSETDSRQCRREGEVVLAATNEYGGAAADLAADSAYDYTGVVDMESGGQNGIYLDFWFHSSGVADNIVFSAFTSINGTDFATTDVEMFSITCTATAGVSTRVPFEFKTQAPFMRFGVKTTGTTNTFDYKISYKLCK